LKYFIAMMTKKKWSGKSHAMGIYTKDTERNMYFTEII
jgi:hypothetical protein